MLHLIYHLQYVTRFFRHYLSSGCAGVHHKEGLSLQQSKPYLSPLENRQQEVWPDFPESSRCQSFRPGNTARPRGHKARFGLTSL